MSDASIACICRYVRVVYNAYEHLASHTSTDSNIFKTLMVFI